MVNSLSRAKNVLSYAIKKVPFYRSRRALYESKKWEEIPPISRKDLEKNWKDFLSADYKNYNLNFRLTSGTTGKPLKMFYNPLFYWQMNFSYLKSLISVGYNPTKILIYYYPIPSERYFFQKLGIYRKVWVSPSLSESEQLSIVSRFNRGYLSYFPTSLLFLIFESKSRGVTLANKFYKVFTQGETLFDSVRYFIEDQMNTKVIDFYGTVEHGTIAREIEKNFYVLLNELALLEVVDEKNEQVSENERGRVLLTTLGNLAFPLIRYEVGDFATVEELNEHCKAISSINRISLENVIKNKKKQIERLIKKGLESGKKFIIIHNKNRLKISYNEIFLIKKDGKYEFLKVV
jgi:phenylacetate-CoA ligase